jgi:CspA family cold shock protein
MTIGIVKWYDCRKGYGFIITAEGEDVLAHFTAIEGTGFRRLFDGEPVEYDATRGPKGLQATRVRHLNHDGHPKENKPDGPTPLDPPVSSNNQEPGAKDH